MPTIPYMFGTWFSFNTANSTTPVTVRPLYVAYAKPTGRACIAFAIENIVIHINRMHKTEGVNFVNPSEILAKLLDAIPKEIPKAKNKYPKSGFIINL